MRNSYKIITDKCPALSVTAQYSKRKVVMYNISKSLLSFSITEFNTSTTLTPGHVYGSVQKDTSINQQGPCPASGAVASWHNNDMKAALRR